MKLLDGSKISFIDTIYLFCVVIYSAMASAFVRELGDPLTVGNIFLVAFSFIMMCNHNFGLSNRFLALSLGLIVYAILTFIVTMYVSLGFIPRWLIYFFVGYVVCQVYKSKMFVALETMILYLTVISVIIWLLYILMPGLVRPIVENFSLPTFSDNINYITHNIIFFTLNGEEAIKNEYFLFERNAGFAWEPGAFGCFICMAILFNLIRTNGQLRKNPSLYILVASLFTTQSTTGGFVFLIILAGWVLTVSEHKVRYAIIFIPLIVYAYSLSFIGDKFNEEFIEASAASMTSGAYNGRIFSFRLAWLEYSKHPIIGLGGSPGTYISTLGIESHIFNGIGQMLITFGLFTIAFFVMLKRTGDCINEIFTSRSGLLLLLFTVACFFSYSLIQTPVYMALTTYGLYFYKYKYAEWVI